MLSPESTQGQLIQHVRVTDSLDLNQGPQLPQFPNDIIPADIWSEIFYRVCQNSLVEYRKSDGEAPIPLSAFTLSHVCRHWRNLATSQSNLWTNIFVFEHTRSPHSLLKMSLRRASTSNLSIWIIAKDSWKFDPAQFLACLKELTNISDRWISLSLELGDTGKAEALKFFNGNEDMALSSSNFGAMEHIEAILPLGDRIPRVSDEYHFIQELFRKYKAFNPLSIRLGCWHPIYADVFLTHQPDSAAIWTSVVSLTCHRQHLARIHFLFHYLSMMPRLESLEFNTCFLMPIYHPTANRPTLKNLKKLSIMDMDDGLAAKTIFEHLLLPALEEVSMSPKFHFRGFREMAETSQCTIRQLSVTIQDTKSFDDLFFLLASSTFQSLEELMLCGVSLDQECIKWLEIAPPAVTIGIEDMYQPDLVSSTKVMPNTSGITHLTLLGCATPDGQLADLAKERMRNGSLRYLYVETNANVEAAHTYDYRVFRDLRRLGFVVDLCTRSRS